MTRPTRIIIDKSALHHNLNQIKTRLPAAKIVAMVKANAYGCGIEHLIPELDGQVDFFGVASLDEALAVHRLGAHTPCALFQGPFNPEELQCISEHGWISVIHHPLQIAWILEKRLPQPITLWLKVNTGMNRLGFAPSALPQIKKQLTACAWVHPKIGLVTHLACADTPEHPQNAEQKARFENLNLEDYYPLSMLNSAGIMAHPNSAYDLIRPGIMLYGVSPFTNQRAKNLGLKPVLTFLSQITAIHQYPPNTPIGYGATWQSKEKTRIGIIPVGYGDGYPRHIQAGSTVWIAGKKVPIVGRISMDMMTVDLSAAPEIKISDPVELWGNNMPIEELAERSGTIAYELLCQLTDRVRMQRAMANY